MEEAANVPGRAGPKGSRSPLVRALALSAGIGIIPILLVELFPSRLHFAMGTSPYLVFHNVAEFFGVMVSLSIFGVGWYTHDQSKDRHALFLACAFLAVGIVDFMHALSYAGMPDFVTPSSPNKASLLWLAGRTVAAAAFLASAFVRSGSSRPWLSKPVLGAAAFVVPAVVFVAVVLFPERIPPAFLPGVGQTAFKRGGEYVVMALLAAAIVAHLRRFAREPDASAALYLAAFAVSALSEAFFAGYRTVTDTRNALGHVYKVVAFYLAYRGIFIASVRRPHRELVEAAAALRREMSDRLAAQEALSRSIEETERERDRVAAVMDASPVAMLRVERDGRIAYVNAEGERVLGVPRAVITRRRHDDPAWGATGPSGEPVTAGELPFEVIARTRAPARARLALRGPGGRRVLVSVVGAPLLDAQGAFDGAVMGLEDVTERSALEEQRRESQKMEAVGRLAGGVAHDFNNLLTAILGSSELLTDQLPAASGLQEEAREIQAAARKATSLTRQLLTFSRRQVVAPKVLDPGELVSGLVPVLQRMIGENVSIEARAPPGAGHVRIDPGQLEQVLVNLVVNARDAMPEGGRVTVALSEVAIGPEEARGQVGVRPGRFVRIEVADTGCGMDAEVLSHAFEPFFTTKAPGKGSGLGLSTLYGIVRQAGGHVRVESAVGAGSVFRVYLPRAEGELAAPEPSSRALWALPPATVLLVEDDLQVRAVVLKVLRRAGHGVLDAADAEEALARAADPAQPIDVLVTDLVMPRIGGVELARRVRAMRPTLPVLFISGYAEQGMDADRLDERSSFLQKPFTPAALADALGRLLVRPGRQSTEPA